MKKIKSFFYVLIAISALIPACSGEEFGGLGIEVPSGNGFVTDDLPYKVVSVFEGGTGHQAGLLPGDIIESIDGRELKGMQHEFIVKNMLRGKVGSVVVLTVKREGKVLPFRVARGKIVLRQE